MMYGFDPGYMGWMMIASTLFWVALVGLAVFAIVRFAPRDRVDNATAILQERLARGEITPEEYTSRRGLIAGR